MLPEKKTMRIDVILLLLMTCGCSGDPPLNTGNGHQPDADTAADARDVTTATAGVCEALSGDEASCRAAGCSHYINSPTWCLVASKCVLDPRPAGVCAHSERVGNNAVSWPAVSDEGFVVQFPSPDEVSQPWTVCAEDAGPEDPCSCFWSEPTEGECS